MLDETLALKFLELLQLSLESRSGLFIDPGFGREEADHDHLIGPFPDGPAKEIGVALLQNINDPVIVNVFSSFADVISAGRADGDLFGNRLVAIWTQSHGLFSKKQVGFRQADLLGLQGKMIRTGWKNLDFIILDLGQAR
jgi:hypothetical protein